MCTVQTSRGYNFIFRRIIMSSRMNKKLKKKMKKMKLRKMLTEFAGDFSDLLTKADKKLK